MKTKLLALICFVYIAFANAQNGFSIYHIPLTGASTAPDHKSGLAIDPTGNKWVCFLYNGLGKFDGSSWTFYNIHNSGLASDTVLAVAFDGANKTWIGTAKGACSFNGSSWATYTTANSGIAGNVVTAINVQGRNIWFGTNAGLSVFDGTTWSTFSKSNSGLVSDTVNTIVFEPNGNLWIGTAKGLSEMQATVWTTWLKNSNIKSICIDASGTKWIGRLGANSFYGPPAVYTLSGNTVTPVSQVLSQGPATIATSVTSLCRGPHGGVMMDALGGGGLASVGSLLEATPLKTYMYVDTLLQWNNYSAFDAKTGKIWFVNWYGSGPRAGLISFDASKYTDLLEGLNYDNCKDLDVNEVRATMMVRGDMDWNHVSAHYEVPKGSGANAIFASALWIGGLDMAESLHQAAMTYRQNGYDYWPGPLDTISGGTDSASAAAYDKIWKIDKFKVQEFIHYFNTGAVHAGTYIPADDILSWPARGNGKNTRNMAPFVDVNHNGIYDPMTGGDYPEIKGDQMLYWIFNDNLGKHTETGGAPLKVEVHASAYAYYCPNIADSDKVLNYTTFYNYQIYNRSAQNYHKVELGMWEDCDLGAYYDDYVGCFPAGNYGYVYNGALCDGHGSQGEYGCKPPMLSTVILNGPPAVPGDGIDNNNNGIIDEPGERNLMTGFTYYNNDFNPVNGNPGSGITNHPIIYRPQSFYEYSTGRWGDSTQITYGGDGVGGTVPTPFMFPNFYSDTTGWSERTAPNSPGDRRFLISCGPFNLKADSMVSFDYAVVFTRDTNLVPNSQAFFMKNKSDNQKVVSWFEQHNAPSCTGFYLGIEDGQKQKPSLEVYPNPADNALSVNYTSGQGVFKISAYDITGKEVIALTQLSEGLHTLDISALTEGIYFLRVQDKDGISCKKFIKR
jgi:hypothetical protein